MSKKIDNPNKDIEINPDTHFRILHTLSDEPYITQRDLAKKLGISLGSVNYCLRGLIKVGHIKVNNFKNNPNKLGYFYLITPEGIKGKALLTNDFLKRKLSEYHALKAEIESIQSNLKIKI